MSAVAGRVAPGFEGVAAAFADNRAGGLEGGAAFAAYVDGRCVVDLWGGDADAAAGRPWEEDTLVPVFSGTKGLAALCLLMLVDRGLLELEAPVARWWPAFAANGKRELLVRHVVSHTAGLPGIRRVQLRREQLLDPELMASLLADEEPIWAPGSVLAYHSLTYGWLVGELVRRADGRSIGRFFADEVAAPLGLDLWIGLPPEQEARVARLELADDWGRAASLDLDALAHDAVGSAIYGNPPGMWERERIDWWNRPEVHRAEIAAAGGIGSAASIARLYGCLACGGELDGVRLLSSQTLAAGREPLAQGVDPVNGDAYAYASGFMLQAAVPKLGPAPDAFGHLGMGGSTHGAWPSRRTGFSYAMTRMRDDALDPRAAALLRALSEAHGHPVIG